MAHAVDYTTLRLPTGVRARKAAHAIVDYATGDLGGVETPAWTVAGLGVKARHAAYVMSEYWDAPIDKIDWDARAVRLLIEAVCKGAGLSLPFRGDDEKTPAADWPLRL